MIVNSTKAFRIGWTGYMLVVLAAGLTSCSQPSSGTGSQAVKPEGAPTQAPDKMGAAPVAQEQQTASAQTKQPDAPAKTEAPTKIEGQYASSPPSPTPPARSEPAPPPTVQPAGTTDEDRRAQAEDMIYATIRIKMEEAIAERAKLLKEGRNPADERIRQLEGTIMRARDLLTEAGEIVEDVDPPIVQTQPKQ
jgi:hypothetical protein